MMNVSSPMKVLVEYRKGAKMFFGLYWADKRFAEPGLYVWTEKTGNKRVVPFGGM